MIKIISLKGYEYEIYEAHEVGIRALTFIPNEGVLISIDEENEVGLWDLQDLESEALRFYVPIIEDNNQGSINRKKKVLASLLYAPSFLSDES